jgi:hypothetical protein
LLVCRTGVTVLSAVGRIRRNIWSEAQALQCPQRACVAFTRPKASVWGVSLAAMTYRLHKLDLLSEWHYRKLYIEISSRGFRKKEPDGGPREISQVLQKVFAALRAEDVSKEDIAAALRVHPKDIDELVFGLAMMSLNGAPHRSDRSRPRPALTLVSTKE